MKQLAPGDAFMFYAEQSGSPNHIGSLGLFDPTGAPGGPVTFDGLVEYFDARLRLGKAFRRRLLRVPFDMDDPWWVEDDSFEIEYHLRHTALPAPGNWKQLCSTVGRIHSHPLDLSRPPWEAWMIEGLRDIPGLPKDAFALLIRVHHTAIDGVGGMELLSALFQLNPDEPPPDVPDNWRPEPVPNSWELAGRAVMSNMAKGVRLLHAVPRAIPKAVQVAAQLRKREIKLPTLAVPTTRFNARVSPHRVFDAAVVDLGELKKIKATVPGATINDVIITVCAGALRSYLDDLGELPEASLAAVCPMSVRSTDEKGAEGNQIAQFFCDMHTDIADPKVRLAAVADSTRVAKESQSAMGAHSLQQMSKIMPGALFGLALRANAEIGSRARTTGLLNTQISNIPGPPFPLYCAGAKLSAIYGLGPVVTGAALIHVVMSYCDRVTFSLTSDREILSDPSVYAEALRTSFGALRDATI
jgi:WS/DGAT/MGAT family acyltransferase